MKVHSIPVLILAWLLISAGVVAGASSVDASKGFIKNRGQAAGEVRFTAPGSRVTTFFTDSALVFDLKEGACAIWLHFEDANPYPIIESRGLPVTRHNYFLGNDPARWQSDVPVYAEVVYRDLWPGIDLVFRNEEQGVTYEVILASGAESETINFRYEGAEHITTLEDGSLEVAAPVGAFTDRRPNARNMSGAFLWPEPADHPTVRQKDDPSLLLWSTYLGGFESDGVASLLVRSSGTVIVTGFAGTASFPTTPGVYDTTFNGETDIFVAEFDSSGSNLLWSTFLGGTAYDTSKGIVIDSVGDLIITGRTGSSDFPVTTGAYDETPNGDEDVIVAKLNGTGNNLLWATYLGGSARELVIDIDVDQAGDVVVTGPTASSDFPSTPGAYDETPNGIYVSKLDATGSVLLWSTFLGGSGFDGSYAVAFDSDGSAIVTGKTNSTDFPTTPGAFSDTYNGGDRGDGFVVKLDASGAHLLWGTYLGGSTDVSYERVTELVIDSAGNPVVIGVSDASDFPTTPLAYDESHNGGGDVFVTKLGAPGGDLIWSTLLGGPGNDHAYEVLLDPAGNILLTGFANSGFPTTVGAYDESFNGGPNDIFVSKLNPLGQDLIYSSFLGGSNEDQGWTIALGPAGNIIVGGGTASADYPSTPGAYDETWNGGYWDGVVAKISLSVADPSAVEDEIRTTPGGCLHLAAHPNPFNPQTILSFTLEHAGQVEIDIYDVTGRRVTALAKQEFSAGPHSLTWDGRDASGRAAPSGTYLFRVGTEYGVRARKVMLIR